MTARPRAAQGGAMMHVVAPCQLMIGNRGGI